MNGLIQYLKASRAELAKVSWPNRRQGMRLTLAVIIFSVGLAAFIGGVDFVFSQLLQKVILKG